MTREHFSTHEDKTVSSAVLRAAKKGAAVVALVPVAVLGVAGCSSNESSAPTTANSEEWTQVWDDGFGVELDSTGKRCDGPNLLYRSGGRGGNIAVSPNDPQCTGKTPENIAGTPSPEAAATDLATAIPHHCQHTNSLIRSPQAKHSVYSAECFIYSTPAAALHTAHTQRGWQHWCCDGALEC